MTVKPFVLFDMDGTLLDTRRDIARAANGARMDLGLPAMTIEEVIMAVGDGVDLFVSRVTYPREDDRFLAAKRIFLKHYEDNVLGDTVPYDGILPLLDQMVQMEIPMGIVSNKPAKLVDKLVQHFKWESYFRAWLGGDSASEAKPSRVPLFLAREQAGLPSDYPIVMVGDGSQDVLAAKNAGCKAVWCSWGFNAEPIDHYPSVRINHPAELLLTIT
jgi:phosphoglycolate phosphatase